MNRSRNFLQFLYGGFFGVSHHNGRLLLQKLGKASHTFGYDCGTQNGQTARIYKKNNIQKLKKIIQRLWQTTSRSEVFGSW